LGFGKTEIFLQKGLDKPITGALSDLPGGHLADIKRRR
jgi:hypothetical protein